MTIGLFVVFRRLAGAIYGDASRLPAPSPDAAWIQQRRPSPFSHFDVFVLVAVLL